MSTDKPETRHDSSSQASSTFANPPSAARNTAHGTPRGATVGPRGAAKEAEAPKVKAARDPRCAKLGRHVPNCECAGDKRARMKGIEAAPPAPKRARR